MRLLSACLPTLRHSGFRQFVFTCGIIFIFAIHPASAAERADTDVESVADDVATIEQVETWFGVDVTENSTYLSSGAVLAPFTSIHDPGWRLRIFSGGGLYNYSGERFLDGANRMMSFDGRAIDMEMMIGYQFRDDWGIVKAYAGAHRASHTVAPYDTYSALQGTRTGAKVIIESWVNLTDEIWLSGDLNYSTAFGDYAATTRLGQRLDDDLSVGVELATFGNQSYAAVRVGALLRWRAEGWGEFQFAAGISGDYAEPTVPYASASYLTRF